MTDQLALDWSRQQGVTAMRRAESSADRRTPDFSRRVAAYFAALLTDRGPMSGEDLVDAAKAAGFTGTGDDRCFGAAFQKLRTDHGTPILRSDLPRRRGHATSGGRLYGRPGS